MHEVSLVVHPSGKQITERGIIGVEPSLSLPFAIKSVLDIYDPASRSLFFRHCSPSTSPSHYFCL